MERIRKLLFRFARLISFSLLIRVGGAIHTIMNILYSGFLSKKMRNQKSILSFHYPTAIVGGKYISIMDNFRALARLRIEAIDKFQNVTFKPLIQIGKNVSIGSDCHIASIQNISIGNNVLIGSYVMITDHFHGTITSSEINIPPNERILSSRGPVIISDNVWIGKGVTILPGVCVGEGCIIGANSVVTSSIPANTVFAGVPAKIIKQL